MKKILSTILVGILVLSGLGASVVAFSESNEKTEMKTLSFTKPEISDYNEEYVEVSLTDSISYIMEADKPQLPKVVELFELPFGIKNVEVDVTTKNIQTFSISKEVRPAQRPMPLISLKNSVELEEDKIVYQSNELFPDDDFDYKVSCGLNPQGEHVTFVSVHVYPVRYKPLTGEIYVAETADITISYEEPENNPFPVNADYDMVIISPDKFSTDIQRLIDHKNSFGVETFLKTTEEIYTEYSGVDEPEQIKYFIKDAIETFGIQYVLLLGGIKSVIWGNPREHDNYGVEGWHVPARYNNIFDNPKFPLAEDVIHDPGVICDLYYADIYGEGAEFQDWDPNGDGVIAAWGHPVYEDNDTGIDMSPDVAVGRLAVRNSREIEIMTDKIITYEQNPADPSWFNRMTVISGDGFLDQQDLNIQWDTNGLPDGDYTIFAQSENPENVKGPIDEIHFKIDKTAATDLTFNHDDHLKIDGFPSPPIAEIVTISEGNTIGNTDFYYKPGEGEAYCNGFTDWANIEYTDGVMIIRGKSYDPKAYGYLTDIHVWIENSNDEVVFDTTVEDTEMYYEGEWVTGDRTLKGGGGAVYYMPPEFERNILWTSNGLWAGTDDIMDGLNQGNGFAFLSGHGSPTSWGNHVAGIPGNRGNAHVGGLSTINLFGGPPFFPMDKLSNTDKASVVVVGGCHNSQFNVSLLATLFRLPDMWTWLPTPECWSWWLARLSKRGGICTIGNTGLGYGILGVDCNIGGLDGGICIEFFKQYGNGYEILGDTYAQTQISYVNQFDMTLQEHGKSLQQWALLGDPSLKIGGYPANDDLIIRVFGGSSEADGKPKDQLTLKAETSNQPLLYEWDLDGDGAYDDAIGEITKKQWTVPGVYTIGVKVNYPSDEKTYQTIVDIEKDKLPNKPSKPAGQTDLKLGTTYTYKFTATDPYDLDLSYIVDWGDGSFDYKESVPSGSTIEMSHRWTRKDSYEVKVLAADSYGKWGEWSDPLTVSITKSRDRDYRPFFEILQEFFEKYPNAFPILRELLGF